VSRGAGAISFDAVARRLAAGFVPAPDKPDETVESTVCALWYAAAGDARPVSRATPPLPALDAAQVAGLEALIARRLAGEPLAYLVGLQEFMGLEFIAAPGALIPRRETELLGGAVLSALAEVLRLRPAPRLLDLCTGCGNLAVMLAHHAPGAELVATDLEQAALDIAARNVQHHRYADRIRLLQGNLFAALAPLGEGPRFDLISCNPPYLSSRHATHMPAEVGASEPVAAFDGGPFGLSIVLRLLKEAPTYLAPGGWLCFEIGAGQQGLVEGRIRQQPGYVDLRRALDAQGVVRAYQLRWQP
jgi:release factor glutamine methyltransferase